MSAPEEQARLRSVGVAFEFGVFVDALVTGIFDQPPASQEDIKNGTMFGSKLAHLLGLEREFLHIPTCKNGYEAGRYIDDQLGAKIISLGAGICNSYNLGIAHFRVSFIGSYQKSQLNGKVQSLIEDGVREFAARVMTLPLTPFSAKYIVRVWNEWGNGRCTPEQADIVHNLVGRYIQSLGWVVMSEIESFFASESSAQSSLRFEPAREFLNKLSNDFPNERWWSSIEGLRPL